MSLQRATFYVLISVAGIGILYFIFLPIFETQLIPVFSDIITNSTIDPATQTLIFSRYSQYMTFFKILPFALFLVAVIYLIVVAVRKEREEEMY